MSKISILGVKINRITNQQVLDYIKKTIDQEKRAQIATVNPEFVVEAQSNNKFKNTLNNVEISVADGVGILAAAKFNSLPKANNRILRIFQTLGQGFFLVGPAILINRNYLNILPETITGSDLCYKLAKFAQKNNYSLYLLGAMPGVAKLASEKLKRKYPGLKIAGCYAGSPDKKEEEEIVEKINRANPDILLVAYGAPAQDLWINRNLNKIIKPVITMGVGGTFDFIAGYKNIDNKTPVRRAPKIYRKLGLEWLYRLIQEPRKRSVRIWNAVVVFPWLVWKNSLKKNLDRG